MTIEIRELESGSRRSVCELTYYWYVTYEVASGAGM